MQYFWQKCAHSDRLAGPILLLLLTVLVPSVGVVWMMREAIRNERLATTQRLREAYQVQLQSASQTLHTRWASQWELLDQQVDLAQPARSFAQLATQPLLDSVLLCDPPGHIVYPDQPLVQAVTPADRDSTWQEAERLEFLQQQDEAAAAVYAQLAREASDPRQRARARQAQVRCLLKWGDEAAAIEVLQVQCLEVDLRDYQGRSFAAAAELRLLEIMDRDTELWDEVAAQLTGRLGNYSDQTLTSSERRFFMAELQRLSAVRPHWPTQSAEEVAAQVVATLDAETKSWNEVAGQLARHLGKSPDNSLTSSERGILIAAQQILISEPWRRPAKTTSETVGGENAHFFPPRLQPTSLPELWSQASPAGRVVGLLRTTTIRDQLLRLTEALPVPRGMAFTISAPRESTENLLDIALGSPLEGWRLGLSMPLNEALSANSQQRTAVHGWTALLVVVITCVLAWLLAITLRRRLRLAKLKNDLVATVSHELKTPLASIRLLVDTLLESAENLGSEQAPVDVREYLELIAHENARLTRLIDNFLTFSRLERGRQHFEFQLVDIRDVVRQAAALFRQRCGAADGCLQVDEGPPAWVWGDLDALVRAVVNLLENAWKYTGAQKQIELLADSNDEHVTLAVRDNGIGLSRRAAKRVFDGFYQVDQRVARTQGGCGFGLSIVRAIVRAHDGHARIQSQAGRGSTVTLCLPRCRAVHAPQKQPVAAEGDR